MRAFVGACLRICVCEIKKMTLSSPRLLHDWRGGGAAGPIRLLRGAARARTDLQPIMTRHPSSDASCRQHSFPIPVRQMHNKKFVLLLALVRPCFFLFEFMRALTRRTLHRRTPATMELVERPRRHLFRLRVHTTHTRDEDRSTQQRAEAEPGTNFEKDGFVLAPNKSFRELCTANI